MKALLARLYIDPYLLMLLGTVALASFLPPTGAWAPISGAAADIGIMALFFLHGARLSRQAVWDGARNWRLHLAVAAMTFAVFPLLGTGIHAVPGLDPELAMGLLFLTLCPPRCNRRSGLRRSRAAMSRRRCAARPFPTLPAFC